MDAMDDGSGLEWGGLDCINNSWLWEGVLNATDSEDGEIVLCVAFNRRVGTGQGVLPVTGRERGEDDAASSSATTRLAPAMIQPAPDESW